MDIDKTNNNKNNDINNNKDEKVILKQNVKDSISGKEETKVEGSIGVVKEKADKRKISFICIDDDSDYDSSEEDEYFDTEDSDEDYEDSDELNDAMDSLEERSSVDLVNIAVSLGVQRGKKSTMITNIRKAFTKKVTQRKKELKELKKLKVKLNNCLPKTTIQKIKGTYIKAGYTKRDPDAPKKTTKDPNSPKETRNPKVSKGRVRQPTIKSSSSIKRVSNTKKSTPMSSSSSTFATNQLAKAKESTPLYNTSIYNMKIKDMDSGEILFWKIVKNKFLFRQLTSFLRTSPFSLHYNMIVDVQSMIDKGQINLLKHKIRNNHHVDLELSPRNPLPAIDFKRLFCRVRKDEEFYKLFLARFSKYVNVSLCVTHAISSDNICAFLVLVEDFNFEPTIETLTSAITNCSIEIIKYLWINVKKLFIGNFTKIWSSISIDVNFKRVFEVINFFIEKVNSKPTPEKSAFYLDNFFDKCPYKSGFKLKHLIRSCITISNLLEIIDKTKDNSSIKAITPSSSTPSNSETSITTTTTITTDTPTNKNILKINGRDSICKLLVEINSNKKKKDKKERKNPYILSREDIESFLYSDKQLKTRVDYFSKSDSHVKLLFKMYLSINNQLLNTNLRYLLSFKTFPDFTAFNLTFNTNVTNLYSRIGRGWRNVSNNNENESKSYLLYAFKYGKLDFLHRWFKSNPEGKAVLLQEITQQLEENKQILFKFIKDDRNAQIEFIGDLVTEIKNTSIPDKVKLDKKTLLSIVVAHDDIDLIDYVFKELSPWNKTEFQLLFNYIKSVTVFEYFYFNLKDKSFFNFSKLYTRSGRLPTEIFEKHQQLLAKTNLTRELKGLPSIPKNVYPAFNQASFSNNSVSSEMCRYVVANPGLFTFDSYVLIRHQSRVLSPEDLPNLLFIINRTDYPFMCTSFHFSDEATKSSFYDYILTEKKQDVDSKRIDIGSAFSVSRAHYLTRRLDLLFAASGELFIRDNFNLIENMVVRNDLTAILTLMARYFPTKEICAKGSNMSRKLLGILQVVIDYNRLQILKAIHSHYNWIFQIRGGRSSIFSPTSIRRLLFNYVFTKDNIDMATFFLEGSPSEILSPLIKLTRKQFLSRFNNSNRDQSIIYTTFISKYPMPEGGDKVVSRRRSYYDSEDDYEIYDSDDSMEGYFW